MWTNVLGSIEDGIILAKLLFSCKQGNDVELRVETELSVENDHSDEWDVSAKVGTETVAIGSTECFTAAKEMAIRYAEEINLIDRGVLNIDSQRNFVEV